MHEKEAISANAQVRVKDCDASDIELGARAILQPHDGLRRFRAVFSGLEVGRYVMLGSPTISSLRERLMKGAPMTVRYLHRGQVRGFRSAVVGMVSQPFPLLFLEYPWTIELLEMRRHGRVNCFLPVRTLHRDQLRAAVLLNLSESGCRLLLERDADLSFRVELGEELQLRARFVDSLDETALEGQVRNLRDESGALNLGLRFQRLSQEARQSIASHLDRQRMWGLEG